MVLIWYDPQVIFTSAMVNVLTSNGTHFQVISRDIEIIELRLMIAIDPIM